MYLSFKKCARTTFFSSPGFWPNNQCLHLHTKSSILILTITLLLGFSLLCQAHLYHCLADQAEAMWQQRPKMRIHQVPPFKRPQKAEPARMHLQAGRRLSLVARNHPKQGPVPIHCLNKRLKSSLTNKLTRNWRWMSSHPRKKLHLPMKSSSFWTYS